MRDRQTETDRQRQSADTCCTQVSPRSPPPPTVSASVVDGLTCVVSHAHLVSCDPIRLQSAGTPEADCRPNAQVWGGGGRRGYQDSWALDPDRLLSPRRVCRVRRESLTAPNPFMQQFGDWIRLWGTPHTHTRIRLWGPPPPPSLPSPHVLCQNHGPRYRSMVR